MPELFSAGVVESQELEAPVIELRYNAADPAEAVSAKIAPQYGSNMFSYQVGGQELIYCDPEVLKDRDWTGTFVLWPVPNRVRNKQFEFEGRAHPLHGVKRKHGNEPLIHGFVDDQPWEHGEPFASEQGASVKTWIDIAPGTPMYEYYPYRSRLTLTYLLQAAGIRIDYAVENRGDKNMPFGFALHPFFAMPSGPDRTLVTLPAEHIMEADDELLPTGKLLPMGSEGYDLRSPMPVSKLMLDDVFTGLHEDAKPTITYPDQKLQMTLGHSNDLTHMVLFTAEQKKGFFCFENQSSAPDAANLDARARAEKDAALAKAAHLLVAGPGETHRGFIHYRIEQLHR